MVQVAVVYGEWVMRDRSWHFVVDNVRGGRLFSLREGFTHAELVEMAREDYNLGKRADLVELTYALPETMMGPDSPPIYVTNDRQVRSMIDLATNHNIRLCVSVRVDDDAMSNVDMDGYAEVADDNCEDVHEKDGNDDSGHDDDENNDDEDNDGDDDCGEGGDVDGDDGDHGDHGDCDMEKQERVFKKRAEEYSDGDDYEVYGHVKDEDASEDEDGKSFGVKGVRVGNVVHGGRKWTDGLYVKKNFSSKEELKAEVRMTAIMTRCAFKVEKSDKKLFVAKCKVIGCPWMVRAALKYDTHTFWVTKYLKVHHCSVGDRAALRKRHLSKYIAKLFLHEWGGINGVTPEQIKDSLRHKYGIKMEYSTAYRALKHATNMVRGTPEDGYARLPDYLHKLKLSNPDTVTALEVDDENKFKFMFIAFGASISGFQYLRKVIVVDGTHLTGRYGGVLLVATGQDGNFQIFPLAFGVVDSENDESWKWFLTKLRECIPDQPGLVIVSDRAQSIENACSTVFPQAERGICYYHLQQNVVRDYRGKHLLYLIKNAAYAYTLYDFNRYMDLMREANPALADYMVNADVKRWSRVHFPGDRYNIKTSNMAESINSALKTARGFPITFLVEFIRAKLGRWFCKRRADALSLTTRFSRGVEYLMAIREYYANFMTSEAIDGWRFHVKGGHRDCIVDLEHGTCDCGVWQIEKIPCSHAMSAAPEIELHTATLVSPFYGADYLYAAYSRNIFPVNNEFKSAEHVICLPPVNRRQPGRQKKSRWQSWLEIAKTKGKPKPRKLHKQYSCSTCKQPGHTRQNCVS